MFKLQIQDKNGDNDLIKKHVLKPQNEFTSGRKAQFIIVKMPQRTRIERVSAGFRTALAHFAMLTRISTGNNMSYAAL